LKEYFKNHWENNSELYDEAVNTVRNYALKNKKTNEFCSGKIDDDYIRASYFRCNVLVLLRRNEKLLGFATLIFNEGYIYIDVLCSAKNLLGGGKKMMGFIISLAESMKIPKLKLESIKVIETLNFYINNGFEYDETTDIDCRISQAITKKGKRKYRNTGLCKMTKNL
jgi:hypothetical protein